MGLVFVYVLTKVLKLNEEVMSNYRAYVEENNHQKTRIIEENIKAMTEVRHSIERLTEKIK